MKTPAIKAFAVIVVGISLAGPVWSKGKERDCWMLTQLNPNSPYSHSQIVIVAPEGVSILADDVKLYMPAPDYKISIYNTTSRQYFEAPLKAWLGKFGALPFSKTGKYMQRFSTGTIGGVAAEQYYIMHGKGADARKQREVWVTGVVNTSRQVQEILQHMCGLPEGSVAGVPLRVIRLLPGGKQDVLLNTLSVKRVATPKGLMKHPSGYVKVQNELALMMNYGKSDELKELLEGTTNSRK